MYASKIKVAKRTKVKNVAICKMIFDGEILIAFPFVLKINRTPVILKRSLYTTPFSL